MWYVKYGVRNSVVARLSGTSRPAPRPIQLLLKWELSLFHGSKAARAWCWPPTERRSWVWVELNFSLLLEPPSHCKGQSVPLLLLPSDKSKIGKWIISNSYGVVYSNVNLEYRKRVTISKARTFQICLFSSFVRHCLLFVVADICHLLWSSWRCRRHRNVLNRSHSYQFHFFYKYLRRANFTKKKCNFQARNVASLLLLVSDIFLERRGGRQCCVALFESFWIN